MMTMSCKVADADLAVFFLAAAAMGE
jgi:hypothetical protein